MTQSVSGQIGSPGKHEEGPYTYLTSFMILLTYLQFSVINWAKQLTYFQDTKVTPRFDMLINLFQCLFVWFWKGGVHGCFSQIFETKFLEFFSQEISKN
jgi:hypothetical protein